MHAIGGNVRKGNSSSLTTTKRAGKKTWKELVKEQYITGKLKGVTCNIYSTRSARITETKPCLCGRLPRQHSFDGEPKTINANHRKFKPSIHAEAVPLSVYGELKNGARVCKDIHNNLMI